MDNLKIKKFHTYPVKVPLRIKPKASTGEIPYGNFVVLKIDTNSDISGNSYVFTFREDMLKPTADLINNVCEGIMDEVIDPNTQIEKLRNLLQNEKEQKNMLQKALESAENTIMDLTIQISTMNSNQFLLPLKSEESQKPRKTP